MLLLKSINGVDPTSYSSHSFCRRGAIFAFCHAAPAAYIKAQGDWKSDAYLVYLTLSEENKFKILHSNTSRLSSNLVPRAFPLKNGRPTHFLREKPWGRGWALQPLYSPLFIYLFFPCDRIRAWRYGTFEFELLL